MITSIMRDWGVSPSIVRINTTDNLSAITTNGYLTTQAATIQLLNNGAFEWATDDVCLINYSNGEGFFTVDFTTNDTFIAFPTSPGFLSSTLANGDIFVGNGSNIATAVAMSGAATISNTGVVTLANNTVDYANLALDVAATATVNLTAAQVNGMYAAPVQLLAAPGSGKLILIDSILWDIAFVSAQYAAGGAIQAQYGNTVHGAGSPASASIAAATLNGVAASGFIANGSGAATLNAPATVKNTAVFLSNATAAFTTGDSTVTLYVKYRVVTPA